MYKESCIDMCKDIEIYHTLLQRQMETVKLPGKATLTTAVTKVKGHQYIVFYCKSG